MGANLEAVLLQYPLIALPLQLMALPGKEGRARKKLGIYERELQPDADVTFPTATPRFWYDEAGVRHAELQALIDPKFRMDQFRRALYHIGYNLLVANKGEGVAHERQYRALRDYVRKPKRAERWPFIQAVTHSLAVFVPQIGAERLDIKGREILRIRIFNTQFYIDLLNSGCLLTARTDGAAHVIGPDWTQAEQDVPPPGVHYRASILKREADRS